MVLVATPTKSKIFNVALNFAPAILGWAGGNTKVEKTTFMKKEKTKILIVEDDSILLKTLAAHFSEEDFTVFKARDGEEGLQLALKKHPDLILLDLIMPKMDGATMFDKLLDDNWGRGVPVIMLTNNDDSETIVKNVQHGISDYLIKSEHSLDDIVKKVKERLGIF